MSKLITDYEIIEKKEQGSIMTCYPLEKNTQRVLNIGTAGGWTKASTGYTFKNQIKKSTALITFLQGDDLTKFHKRTKFWFTFTRYFRDREKTKRTGIFSSMFKKGIL
jgi:lycopene beta-cyclase